MTVLDRAYSWLDIKSINEEQRIIEGIATSPKVDRMGDIVDPMGLTFAKVIPLLLFHDSTLPVGQVSLGRPTKDGVPFTAYLPKVTEPGTVKDRVDEAWQSVKYGLIPAVSIGFRILDDAMERIATGWKYLKAEIMELSLVPIPAQDQAIITGFKSMDASAIRLVKQFDVGAPAAIGTRAFNGDLPPGASGKTSSNPTRQETKMKTSEKIAALEARRTECVKSWETLKNLDTKTADQKAQIKQYREEVEALDEEIDDEKAFEAAVVAKITKAVSDEPRGRMGGIGIPAQPKKEEKQEPGVLFTQIVKAQAMSRLKIMPLDHVVRHMYGEDSKLFGAITKANEVLPGTAASGNWGYDLISQEGAAVADFVEFLRSQMIVGKFGTGGIPALNGGVGFYEPYVTQTGGGAGYWVGEAKPKPLTSFDFDRSTMTPLKMANIAVLSEENIKRSSPKSDIIIRDQLVKALVELQDTTFIDPSNSGSANVKPASITNGSSAIASTGDDADAIRLDVRALLKKYTDAHNPPRNGVLIMSSDNAIALGTMVNALGQPEFPGIGLDGGRLLTLPVIVSDYVSTNVVMANASDIYYVDEGVAVDTSNQVSLEMKSASLTQDGSAGTGASLVSMWQNNMIAYRAEMTVNWKKRRSTAVAYLSGVTWGGAVPAS